MLVNEKFIEENFEEILQTSYLKYAQTTILNRAIPDIRDGLKPVHRRIIYSMYEQGITHDKPYKKSARIVGDVLGKYHPHGDSAVYDALVNLAQEFKNSHPLIEGQGNFGSLDGDNAAAMRYTEARLSPITQELVSFIEKNTVSFQLNFDESLTEPTVLPALYPNLLVSGSEGIAVGLASKIPPHNLGEVIDALLYYIENPDCSISELLNIMPGPDFITGGIVGDKNSILKAYETGKGVIKIRGKFIEEVNGKSKTLVVTEIPYQVNKANLVKQISNIVFDKDKKKNVLIGDIVDVRDESDRNGIRIVIECKKEADTELIKNYLYSSTDLETSFGINMMAIAAGQPQVLNLKDIFQHFLSFRKETWQNKCRFELDKAQKRKEIVDGLIKAINIIDDVIVLIKKSPNSGQAEKGLIEKFGFTEIQARAILDMRLARLTNLEITALTNEQEKLIQEIKHLLDVLNKPELLIKEIKKDLLRIKKEYALPRKTEVVDSFETVKINKNELIKDEEMVVVLSQKGFIKTLTLANYNRSEKNPDVLEDDILDIIQVNKKGKILMFTNLGNCYQLPVINIREERLRDKGQHLSVFNLLEPGEECIGIVDYRLTESDNIILFITEKGLCKATELKEYSSRRKKIDAIKLKDNDRVIRVLIYNPTKTNEANLYLVTQNNLSLAFSLSEIPIVGKNSSGVIGIRVNENDFVRLAWTNNNLDWYQKQQHELNPLIPISQRNKKGKPLINNLF